MEDDSIPDIEIDTEPTESTSSVENTRPHATVEWLSGFDEGRRRGGADVLDALAGALSSVGVSDEVSAAIVAKVRSRAGLEGG